VVTICASCRRDIDETIVILEGSILLEWEGMPVERYGIGDLIFFRNGAHAKWHSRVM
jgi:uncharacterized cupin superfamily protein